MKIQRREFLKTSLAATATAALVGPAEAAPVSAGAIAGREFYELRVLSVESRRIPCAA